MKLLDKCIAKECIIVISFYSIHELFLLPFEYKDEKEARKIGLILLK
ncbi:Uncharacterised protein [uncultured archaeon]|nr:Uncharacterised protein [uncultured archaeon]